MGRAEPLEMRWSPPRRRDSADPGKHNMGEGWHRPGVPSPSGLRARGRAHLQGWDGQDSNRWRCGGLHREGATAPIWGSTTWGKAGISRASRRLRAPRSRTSESPGLGWAGRDPLEMRWSPPRRRDSADLGNVCDRRRVPNKKRAPRQGWEERRERRREEESLPGRKLWKSYSMFLSGLSASCYFVLGVSHSV